MSRLFCLSPQKYSGIEGIGLVHTSSPTSPTSVSPSSSNAKTAIPKAFACISPFLTSSIGLPTTKAAAKSVPPEMGANQTSDFTQL